MVGAYVGNTLTITKSFKDDSSKLIIREDDCWILKMPVHYQAARKVIQNNYSNKDSGN